MNRWNEQVELPQDLRILFLGDSITENGTYIRDLDAFWSKYLPDRRIEWIGLGVSSETSAGASENAHPFPRPCVHERLDRALSETRPDWVFVCYGMNDGIYHPLSEELFAAYRSGIEKTVAAIFEAGAQPILMTPPPFDAPSATGRLLPLGMPDYSFEAAYERYDDVLARYAEWVLRYGRRNGLKTVDLRSPLLDYVRAERERDPGFRYGDGIHPEAPGHAVIARTILSRVFRIELERMPEWLCGESEFLRRVTERRELLKAAWREYVGHSNPNKFEALPLEQALQEAEARLPDIRAAAEREGGTADERTSDWNGFERTDYVLEGRSCSIVRPKRTAEGRPWIWRTEFFGHFPAADLELLRRGWHVAYAKLSDLYGSPVAAERMEEFRADAVRRFALDARPVLEGLSRGGLYAVRYAETYPRHTRAMYLDAPVADIASWPGGLGSGYGSPEEWLDCLAVYGIDVSAKADEASIRREARQIAEELLAGLTVPAQAGIPILLVAGGQDEAVPLEENGELLERRYREAGGTIDKIVKPECGHHPHGLEDPEPIVRFALASLDRSRVDRFEQA
ncbi:GDSL-type esterase/lipase family protein [Saccharibacillus sp. O23]|uniref:GDSL-type esterase/lipase family protein n=1 Tax=Saccharibacillus sp. O23 TaxID=2009338 RepID=UPI0015C633C2|nr:GDSL-type esterase/lipase family protein [Saccharibacillus sp. O23]